MQAAVLLLMRLQTLLLWSDLPNHAVNVMSFPVGVVLGGHSGLGCQACRSGAQTEPALHAGRQAETSQDSYACSHFLGGLCVLSICCGQQHCLVICLLGVCQSMVCWIHLCVA